VTKQITQTTTNIATAAAGGCEATSNPVTVTVTRGNACPRTLGFWKNHPSDWPVSSLTLGGKTYTKAELIKILDAGGEGDASIILARQLIATKLSIANCSDPAPIETRAGHADTLLSAFPGKLPYRVSPSSQTGKAMISDATVLDRYNNSRMTPNCTGPK
jgi:hypothetical protein